MIRVIYLLLIVLVTSNSVKSETIWSDYSVSYLKGNNYELGDSKRSVLTFEYVTATSWGDSFMFFDRLESDNGDLETYGEWSPRIKLTSFDESFIKNLSLAATIEMGAFAGESGSGSGKTNYLSGVGIDLDLPGVNYFQVNFYHRNNDSIDNNYQTTLVWGVPVMKFYYDGFLDYTTSSDDKASSFNLTSQFKYNIAPHFSLKNKLYIGIEYVYWLNKFGTDDVDEKNANILIKYHF